MKVTKDRQTDRQTDRQNILLIADFLSSLSGNIVVAQFIERF